MTAPNWQRPRFNGAGGPIDEYPLRSAPPGATAGAPDTTGQSAPSLGWMLTRQVPEEAPPPGSTFFNSADSVGLVAAGVQPMPNATFQLDQDRYGVLKSIDFEVTNYTAASDVRFTLLVNGGGVPGFTNVRIPPAAASLKARGFDMSLALPRGATITVTVNDIDGGVYTANVAFFGWQWPAAIDARYRPEGVGVR